MACCKKGRRNDGKSLMKQILTKAKIQLDQVQNCPLISVIIPVYNVENYLRECVDSVINQTYHYIEIILVDDGVYFA